MAIRIVDAKFVEENIGKLPIVDVRTVAEYEAGYIPGAVNVDLYTAEAAGNDAPFFMARGLKAYGIEPDDECIVYCLHGVRAKVACDYLEAAGYMLLDCYDGSYADWISDPNRPVQK